MRFHLIQVLRWIISQMIGAAYFRRGFARSRNLRSRRRKSKRDAHVASVWIGAVVQVLGMARPRTEVDIPLHPSAALLRSLASVGMAPAYIKGKRHPGTAITPLTIAPARITTASRHSPR